RKMLFVSTPTEEGTNGGKGMARAASGVGSIAEEGDDDDDRLDAKNAASRLATSTFYPQI
ncbi:hypothetical protein V1517DRAFT_342190, partial [Lipomyces orientalis]